MLTNLSPNLSSGIIFLSALALMRLSAMPIMWATLGP